MFNYIKRFFRKEPEKKSRYQIMENFYWYLIKITERWIKEEYLNILYDQWATYNDYLFDNIEPTYNTAFIKEAVKISKQIKKDCDAVDAWRKDVAIAKTNFSIKQQEYQQLIEEENRIQNEAIKIRDSQ